MADITRAEVASLIAEEYGGNILAQALQASAVLTAFPTVSMGTKTTHMPVLTTLPTAGWVIESATAPEGVKPTADAVWANRTLVAEELAVILPIHEDVVADATTDLLTELSGLAGQAIGRALDEAVLFGVNKPASWTSDDLLAAAVAASQTVAVVDGPANAADIYGATIAAAGLVAESNWNPTTLIAPVAYRYAAANIRGTDGHPVLVDNGILGFETVWSRNGAWDAAEATAFVVDPTRVRIGVRQDVTVKFLDQATVGTINLAERDMIALRVKARYAYVLANDTAVAAVTPDVTP